MSSKTHIKLKTQKERARIYIDCFGDQFSSSQTHELNILLCNYIFMANFTMTMTNQNRKKLQFFEMLVISGGAGIKTNLQFLSWNIPDTII